MNRILWSALFLVLLPAASHGQGPGRFQYAVKFVCGRTNGPVVAPGVYYTAINVHNPGEKSVGLRKKIAIALPSEKAGRVSKFFEAKLGPDEAFEIDCPDILKHAETEGFVKGFVVVETEVELDIVAVYTTAGTGRTITTFSTERVPARRL
jgi:hypothetical protein